MSGLTNLLLSAVLLVLGASGYLHFSQKGFLLYEDIRKESGGRVLFLDCTYFTGTSLMRHVPQNALINSCPWLIDR